VMWLLDRAHALVDPFKDRIRIWLRMFSPARAGRTLRLFRRIPAACGARGRRFRD
jgi:hypothetical protein